MMAGTNRSPFFISRILVICAELVCISASRFTTCSMESVEEDDIATLTCDLGSNMQDQNHRKDVIIKRNTFAGNREDLLDCFWDDDSDDYVCMVKHSSFYFNGLITEQVAMKLLITRKEDAGNYTCDVVRKQAIPCSFTVKEKRSTGTNWKGVAITFLLLFLFLLGLALFLGYWLLCRRKMWDELRGRKGLGQGQGHNMHTAETGASAPLLTGASVHEDRDSKEASNTVSAGIAGVPGKEGASPKDPPAMVDKNTQTEPSSQQQATTTTTTITPPTTTITPVEEEKQTGPPRQEQSKSVSQPVDQVSGDNRDVDVDLSGGGGDEGKGQQDAKGGGRAGDAGGSMMTPEESQTLIAPGHGVPSLSEGDSNPLA